MGRRMRWGAIPAAFVSSFLVIMVFLLEIRIAEAGIYTKLRRLGNYPGRGFYLLNNGNSS
jgi:hypothetical protein